MSSRLRRLSSAGRTAHPSAPLDHHPAVPSSHCTKSLFKGRSGLQSARNVFPESLGWSMKRVEVGGHAHVDGRRPRAELTVKSRAPVPGRSARPMCRVPCKVSAHRIQMLSLIGAEDSGLGIRRLARPLLRRRRAAVVTLSALERVASRTASACRTNPHPCQALRRGMRVGRLEARTSRASNRCKLSKARGSLPLPSPACNDIERVAGADDDVTTSPSRSRCPR
jgi:hypothetical protein